MKYHQKLDTSTKKGINRGKKSMEMNKVRPAENINNNLMCFSVQNEVPPSNKRQDHAYH